MLINGDVCNTSNATHDHAPRLAREVPHPPGTRLEDQQSRPPHPVGRTEKQFRQKHIDYLCSGISPSCVCDLGVQGHQHSCIIINKARIYPAQKNKTEVGRLKKATDNSQALGFGNIEVSRQSATTTGLTSESHTFIGGFNQRRFTVVFQVHCATLNQQPEPYTKTEKKTSQSHPQKQCAGQFKRETPCNTRG